MAAVAAETVRAYVDTCAAGEELSVATRTLGAPDQGRVDPSAAVLLGCKRITTISWFA